MQFLQIACSKESYLKWTLINGNGFCCFCCWNIISNDLYYYKKSVEKLDFIFMILFYILNDLEVIQNILKFCY